MPPVECSRGVSRFVERVDLPDERQEGEERTQSGTTISPSSSSTPSASSLSAQAF
ncbi:hypothetical protein [Roseiarcus sp.]|uniref:hypothetical protein n=1 Tax=Roseiarcus sp. TaxID=1969460 RepID=UPI003F9CE85E